MESRRINTVLYKKIVRVLPISCVDVVIVSRGSASLANRGVAGGKFLLGKRKNKPAKGKWWLIGGRIRKGERLEQAARRHVKTETGMSRVKIKKLLGTTETLFRNSAHGPGTHTVNTIFLAEISSNGEKISLPANSENSELAWFSVIDKSWHLCVRQMLRLAGFK